MRRQNVGLFALFGLGIYALWRNRQYISQFLESQGVTSENFRNTGVGQKISQGVSRISETVEHGVERLTGSGGTTGSSHMDTESRPNRSAAV